MQRQQLVQTAAGLGVAAALLAVFTLYLRPDFLLLLADQVWTCF